MKFCVKPLLIAGLLAAAALSAEAQPGPGPGGPGPNSEVQARMQERMTERMGRRTTDLKAKLKLTAAQEGAWSSYVAAMKPPATTKWPTRAELDKLTTPERLDKMRELRKAREAEMDQRAEATKAFYASLTPEQKKIFDANSGRSMRYFDGRGPR